MAKKKQTVSIKNLISKGNDLDKSTWETLSKPVKTKVENNNSFFDQYKNPKWQKKRLEIMERDNFMCCHCQDDESTLNVHHLIYINGFKPWDYEDDDLITLCERCHKDITTVINVLIPKLKRSAKWGESFYELFGIIEMLTDKNPYQLMLIKKIIEQVIQY